MAAASQRKVARAAGVSQPAVNNALKEGKLDRTPDGRIDFDGPNTRAWIASHLNRVLAAGTKAQVNALLAKARWQAAWCRQREAEYLDRRVTAEAARTSVATVLAGLPALPDRYGGWLAGVLKLSEPVAREILSRTAVMLAKETREFPDQAYDTIMRLRR